MLKLFCLLLYLLSFYRFFCLSNILQKQYYELNRFFIYFFQNKIHLIYKVVVILSSLLLSFINVNFCFLYLLFFIEPFKNKIIKFQFTHRIKRQFLVFVLFNTSLLIFFLLCKSHPFYVIALFFGSYYLSFFISLVIEKLIQSFYLKKAKNKLKSYKTKIIAISGSYGKTSLKNYVYELIKDKYFVLKSPLSYNTFNGLLLTINKYLKPHHEWMIVEIGVDRKNGMDKFIKHFNFDISALTCIGPQHLKTFKSLENIAKEKSKLFINSKTIIKNIDDPFIKCVNLPGVLVSCKETADVMVKKKSNNNISIHINDKTYNTTYNLIGTHNLSNLVIALAIINTIDVIDITMINKISSLKNVKHRLSISCVDNFTFIDDSYNSNYQGFLNALDVLKEYKEKKIIITPGTIENIDKNNEKAEEICKKISSVCDEALIINNKNYASLIKFSKSFFTFKDAYDYLKEKYKTEHVVILIENDLPDIYLR